MTGELKSRQSLGTWSDSSVISALAVSAEGPGSNLGSACHQMLSLCPPSSKMCTWLLLGSEGGGKADWPPTPHAVPAYMYISVALTHLSLAVL